MFNEKEEEIITMLRKTYVNDNKTSNLEKMKAITFEGIFSVKSYTKNAAIRRKRVFHFNNKKRPPPYLIVLTLVFSNIMVCFKTFYKRYINLNNLITWLKFKMLFLEKILDKTIPLI